MPNYNFTQKDGNKIAKLALLKGFHNKFRRKMTSNVILDNYLKVFYLLIKIIYIYINVLRKKRKKQYKPKQK